MEYQRPLDLPQYTRPPLTDVRLEMVFEPLQIRSVDLPQLIAAWAGDYPELDEYAPELVDIDDEDVSASLRIEFEGRPRIPRIHFRDEDDSRWIEVQSDRLACGWSKREDGTYPHYEVLRDQFFNIALDFADFVSEDAIQVVNLSMVYVNEFDIKTGDPLAALGQAYCVGGRSSSPAMLDELETASFSVALQRKHEGRRWAGLQARASARRVGDLTRSRFRLRFAGDPFKSPTADDHDLGLPIFFDFFDAGHDFIVRTFTDMTEPALHNEWGRSS